MTLGRLSDPPPHRLFTGEVAGDSLRGDTFCDEVHLGSDLGEDGGGSELLQLGALDLPDPHPHVDDVDRQTDDYQKKRHNCDENPPSLIASLNRCAVTRSVDLPSLCSLHTCSPRVAPFQSQIFHCEKHPLDFCPTDTFYEYCDLKKVANFWLRIFRGFILRRSEPINKSLNLWRRIQSLVNLEVLCQMGSEARLHSILYSVSTENKN